MAVMAGGVRRAKGYSPEFRQVRGEIRDSPPFACLLKSVNGADSLGFEGCDGGFLVEHVA